MTFGGGSLTVQNGGTLNLYKSNTGGYYEVEQTINNLTINNSTVRPQTNVASIAQEFLSPVTFLGASTIDASVNPSYTCRMIFSGAVSGSGTLDVWRDATGSTRNLDIKASMAAYSGDITMRSTVSETFGARFFHADGWGTGELILANYGQALFQAGVAVTTTGTINLTDTDATIDLSDGAHSIAGLTIMGNIIDAGTYTAADLTALGYGGTYSGAGTIEVVPEPATMSLLALGGIAMLKCRKK